jgi:hypothetical protein
MKRLWLTFLFCVLHVPAWALDREAFTFTNYNLDVRIEPEQQRIGVRGRVTLRNDSASPQKYVCLQISSSLGWRSIQIGEKSVEFTAQRYTTDVDHSGALSEAIVTLPQEIAPHGTIELTVGYEGTIALDTTRLERIGVPKEVAKHSDWDEIGKSFTAVRGVGYVTWYPVAIESASLSDGNSVAEAIGRWKQREAQSEMAVTLVLPSETITLRSLPRNNDARSRAPEQSPILVCGGKNGPLTDEEVDAAPYVKIDCSFSSLNILMPAFAAGGYLVLDHPSVAIYYLPQEKPGAENFALADEVELPFITEWFGPPREKVKIIELQDPHSSPFESGPTLLTPLVQNDSTKYSLTAVHQLTHAAFYSSRSWIYEGLAHFAQAASVESKSGRQAALDFMDSHRAAFVTAERAFMEKRDPNTAAGESLINTTTEEFYRSKAMYVWWMLREMVGDVVLKHALAAYHSDQDKEPSYMPRLIEEHSKRDLEWFFDDWVYRDRGLPDFRVESAYPRKLPAGGYLVTVTVENLGNAGAEVPIIMKFEGGEIRKRLEVRAKSKASIRIETAATPQEVIVNDGSVPESDMSNNSYKIAIADTDKEVGEFGKRAGEKR